MDDDFVKAVMWVAIVTIICFTIGGVTQCHYDNEAMLKCIDKTGDKFCGHK